MSLTRRAGDLIAARERLASGAASALSLMDASLHAAATPAAQNAFLRLFPDLARAQAEATDRLAGAGAPQMPLAGLAVSVKDLFDIAGQPTTGGSAALADAAPAACDSTTVARLRAAGAALIGHTNLSEFAFSGVGINPHHGTPANPVTALLDQTPRIPGGSTSGGAVSVASGAAWAALGSDTGGSIRIPAALQGLVGFKNTQRLTPPDGCIPLAPSLDTGCAITWSVRDAVLLHEVLAARQVRLQSRPLKHWRLAVPTTLMLDGLEPEVERCFRRTIASLRAVGATVDELPLPMFDELAGLNANGGLPAAESWAWHRKLLAHDATCYDPRVALRIRRGSSMTAADYIDLLAARRDWITRTESACASHDAWLAPTVPMVAPPLAPLLADDAAFFATNARLLRNPSVVNFLDGCALSLPCHGLGGWPVGLMVFAPALQDDAVLSVGLAIEHLLAQTDR
jgi:Asp-tRNA(Asn)/Glu-tRNA(Gln) amidotransferase A subunit family amidase